MRNWLIAPTKLEALREEAQLTPEEMAARAGCHPQHYRKFEREQAPGLAVEQPSDSLGWSVLKVLGGALGRVVSIGDIAVRKVEHQKDAA